MPTITARKSRRVLEDPLAAPPPRVPEVEDHISKRNAKDFAEQLDRKAAKKSTHGPLPAGIAANDPDFGDDRAWQESPEGAIQQLDLDELRRHPDNRQPTPADVAAMGERLLEQKQLEPIVVWRPFPGDSPYGPKCEDLIILSGETRYIAAKQLGWPSLQGRVATNLTPAQALELLAAYNGERRDLDPMQKARLINRLCQPIAEGGSGLTRQAAGERVGLESGAAASNLVRLLELPKKWQDRVASGELAWTWARELIPYLPVFKAIDEELDRDWKNRETDRWDNAFESRAALTEQLDRVVDQACPRLDRTEIWVGNKHRKLTIDVKDPDTVAKLGIVELELATGKKGQTEKVPVATNSEAFDELVAEFKAKGAKAAAAKSGDDDKPEKRELSSAEKKQKAADRTKLLGARIAAWRQKLIRRELLCKLADAADDGFRLVMAYIAGRIYTGPTPGDLLEKASGVKSVRREYDEVYWPCVADLPPGIARNSLTRDMARHLLAEEPADWRRPVLPPALVEGYAEDLQVDVVAAWRDLQIAGDGNKLAGEDLLEEFFLYYQTDELRDLAKELGKHVPETATRTLMVKILLGVPRGSNQRLPLPKSIKPVAGVKVAKAKKGAK